MCEVVGAPLNLRMAAGVPVDIFIAAKDAKGNHKSVGGDVFCVSWTHAAGGGATNGAVLRAVGLVRCKCTGCCVVMRCHMDVYPGVLYTWV